MLEKGKGGMRMVSSDGVLSPFELDEVHWQEDAEVNMCQGSDCTNVFSFMSRKHHCRRCGKIFCDKCCGHKMGVPRMLYADPQRVCNKCKPSADNELTFFTKILPVLQKGAKFSVTRNNEPVGSLFVSLSKDHKFIRFTNSSNKDKEDKLNPLKVQQIHCHEDPNKLVVRVETKKEGSFRLETSDKDVAKQWRKSTRHIVKLLHPKLKLAKTESSS